MFYGLGQKTQTGLRHNECMNRPPPSRLKLGDNLNGTIVNSIGGRRFSVQCKGIPDGWKAELHSRRPETIRLGSLGTFWIAKISPLQGAILLHDGDFGRLQISDAMRERYLKALRALLADGDMSGDEIADARSMVLRIEKKDQADWLSVWRVFGEPDTGTVKLLTAALESLRSSRKENPDDFSKLRADLIEKHGGTIQLAIAKLQR